MRARLARNGAARSGRRQRPPRAADGRGRRGPPTDGEDEGRGKGEPGGKGKTESRRRGRPGRLGTAIDVLHALARERPHVGQRHQHVAEHRPVAGARVRG